MRPNNNQQQQQNGYRNNRQYDEIVAPRWKVMIENQSYYFLDYDKAWRCRNQFWEASDPVQVSFNQYRRDPNR